MMVMMMMMMVAMMVMVMVMMVVVMMMVMMMMMMQGVSVIRSADVAETIDNLTFHSSDVCTHCNSLDILFVTGFTKILNSEATVFLAMLLRLVITSACIAGDQNACNRSD